MLKQFRSFFSFKQLSNLLELSKNYELKTIIFRLLRNLYIFHEDNIFDDEQKINEMIAPLPTIYNSNSTVYNTRKVLEENYAEMFLPILVDELKIFINKANTYKTFKIDSKEKIPSENTIIKDKFEQKEKKKYIDFGGNMLISTISHLSTFFISKKLLTNRKGNILKSREINNIETIKTKKFEYISQLLNILLKKILTKKKNQN